MATARVPISTLLLRSRSFRAVAFRSMSGQRRGSRKVVISVLELLAAIPVRSSGAGPTEDRPVAGSLAERQPARARGWPIGCDPIALTSRPAPINANPITAKGRTREYSRILTIR
jgi:hypothetical protein